MSHLEDVERCSVHSKSQELSHGSSPGEGPVHEYNDPEKVLTPQSSEVSKRPPLSRIATSIGTTETPDPNYEVEWEEDDSENPRNWPLWYKGIVICFMSWSTWSYVSCQVTFMNFSTDDIQSYCIFNFIYNRYSPAGHRI